MTWVGVGPLSPTPCCPRPCVAPEPVLSLTPCCPDPRVPAVLAEALCCSLEPFGRPSGAVVKPRDQWFSERA